MPKRSRDDRENLRSYASDYYRQTPEAACEECVKIGARWVHLCAHAKHAEGRSVATTRRIVTPLAGLASRPKSKVSKWLRLSSTEILGIDAWKETQDPIELIAGKVDDLFILHGCIRRDPAATYFSFYQIHGREITLGPVGESVARLPDDCGHFSRSLDRFEVNAPKKSASDFLASCKLLKKRGLRVIAQLLSQAGVQIF
jgi:hypothetical protein